ncbi:MAG: DUF1311 domain-containing protein [Acidobacteria bacterium]|nr:DUF1311 domain-containing protein [Acidobacteriota bacterium]
MKKIFTLVTLLGLLVFQAVAQKAPPKPGCADAQDQNTMNRCAQEEFQKADAALNKAYQQLLPKLEAAHKEKLKMAQRAWIAFRDAHCECEAFAFDGGSMQPLIRFSCMAAETNARTKQLQAMLKEMTSR